MARCLTELQAASIYPDHLQPGYPDSFQNHHTANILSSINAIHSGSWLAERVINGRSRSAFAAGSRPAPTFFRQVDFTSHKGLFVQTKSAPEFRFVFSSIEEGEGLGVMTQFLSINLMAMPLKSVSVDAAKDLTGYMLSLAECYSDVGALTLWPIEHGTMYRYNIAAADNASHSNFDNITFSASSGLQGPGVTLEIWSLPFRNAFFGAGVDGFFEVLSDFVNGTHGKPQTHLQSLLNFVGEYRQNLTDSADAVDGGD
ncbi:g7769 [Coccomyxa viridis]|uniref:G7769 protein n=1 Tax=Coccomyxa viridis TaxID=1274662 RepID=A0ABP1G150_9CHLO